MGEIIHGFVQLLYVLATVVFVVFIGALFLRGKNIEEVFFSLFFNDKNDGNKTPYTTPKDLKSLDEKDKTENQKIKEYLISIGKISYESSPEDIQKEIDKLGYEMREEILHNQIKKVANDIEKNNGPVQVSFDEAMYMLRHYKNRSVISEDGRVFIGGANVSRSQRNVFQEFKNDQQNLQKQKEKILLENTSDDEEIHVQSSNGLRVISSPSQGEQVAIQNNKVVGIEVGEKRESKKENQEEILDAEVQQSSDEDIKLLEEKILHNETMLKLVKDDMLDLQARISRAHGTEDFYTLTQDLTNEKLAREKIEKENQTLQEKINTCKMTRAKSKSKFDDDFEYAVKNIKDTAVVFFDGDKFKTVNDTYGHEGGDLVLIRIVDNIYKHIRHLDGAEIYRIGGDEFVLIFTNHSPEFIFFILEEIRLEMQNSIIIDANKNEIRFTMSFGVSFLFEAEDGKEFLARADKALYDSKESGKNRISVSKDNPFECEIFEEEKIKSQAQRFKEIFGAEYEQYLSIINENMKQKTQDQSENQETNFKRREIDSEVDSQEENPQNDSQKKDENRIKDGGELSDYYESQELNSNLNKSYGKEKEITQNLLDGLFDFEEEDCEVFAEEKKNNIAEKFEQKNKVAIQDKTEEVENIVQANLLSGLLDFEEEVDIVKASKKTRTRNKTRNKTRSKIEISHSCFHSFHK